MCGDPGCWDCRRSLREEPTLPTVADLFALLTLHAVWEALALEMAACPCLDAPHGNALCPRCDCLTTVAEAARARAAVRWGSHAA
jgi:hypothetical protein